MVKCYGCQVEVYFDQKLHIKLLKAKGLDPDEVMKEGSKLRDDGLGSGRPFDFGSEPPTVHQCPGFDPVTGTWTGREKTTKNVQHGYVYNAHNIKNDTQSTITAKISPKLSDYANNNKPKPITPTTTDKAVIVFSEQSILETQKQIMKDIELISNKIETMNKTIDFIKYILYDKMVDLTKK